MDLQIKPLMMQHINATCLPSVGYKTGTLRTTWPLIQQPVRLGAWVEERSTTKVNTLSSKGKGLLVGLYIYRLEPPNL